MTEKRSFLEEQKNKLTKLTNDVHNLMTERGMDTVSTTQIIPIVIGSNEDTVKISEKLRAEGFYIPAIRPPTVPEGTSRLRISLTADCKLEDFAKVLDIVR